jgi:hypothetical protein
MKNMQQFLTPYHKKRLNLIGSLEIAVEKSWAEVFLALRAKNTSIPTLLHGCSQRPT